MTARSARRPRTTEAARRAAAGQYASECLACGELTDAPDLVCDGCAAR